MSTPTVEGYFMPAEWDRQRAVWLSWPLNPATWPDRLGRIQARFAELAALLSRFEEVRINCRASAQTLVRRQLTDAGAELERVALFDVPTNDVWCRDHGPTFVRNRTTGRVGLVDWRYNAWGGKFPPWDEDDAVPRRLAEVLDRPVWSAPLVCEGGALEVNGEDLVLTTESVLLNRNRNPGRSREEIESLLRDYLGVRRVAWLGSGLATDDTDGHIDTLARFWKADGIVAIREANARDADYRPLEANWERLRGLRTPSGGTFDLAPLPQPDPVFAEGTRTARLPATYANFLILNGAVLVPAYGQPRCDEQARGLLGELFPGRQALSLDSLDILREGGSFHCLTQQEPAEIARNS